MDRYFKDVLQNNKDFNVRQFHSMSYLDLKYLQDTIGGRQDLLREVRQETDQIGDCCLLTFFEYGLSTPDEVFHDGNNSDLLEYKYSVNERFVLCDKWCFVVAWEGQGCTLPIVGHNWTFWYVEQGEEDLQHCGAEEAEGSQ